MINYYDMQLEMILPDRAYAFFSHTHKAQKENMPLLDKVYLSFKLFDQFQICVVLLLTCFCVVVDSS